MGPRGVPDGCGKSRPHRDRSPDRLNPSESLYRLSYRGTNCFVGEVKVDFVYVSSKRREAVTH